MSVATSTATITTWAFQATRADQRDTCDSFECAIQAMAPRCAHCARKSGVSGIDVQSRKSTGNRRHSSCLHDEHDNLQADGNVPSKKLVLQKLASPKPHDAPRRRGRRDASGALNSVTDVEVGLDRHTLLDRRRSAAVLRRDHDAASTTVAARAASAIASPLLPEFELFELPDVAVAVAEEAAPALAPAFAVAAFALAAFGMTADTPAAAVTAIGIALVFGDVA